MSTNKRSVAPVKVGIGGHAVTVDVRHPMQSHLLGHFHRAAINPDNAEEGEAWWRRALEVVSQGEWIHPNHLARAIARWGVPPGPMALYVACRFVGAMKGPRGKPKGTRHGRLPQRAALLVEYSPLKEKHGHVKAKRMLSAKYGTKYRQIEKRLYSMK